jgi:hypothetical protein
MEERDGRQPQSPRIVGQIAENIEAAFEMSRAVRERIAFDRELLYSSRRAALDSWHVLRLAKIA